MPEQGPRKTKTYKQFEGMNSQDERYGAEDTEFFWLENIMRIGDGKLASVPGPSLVAIQTVPIPELFHFLLLETGGYLLLESLGRIDLNG